MNALTHACRPARGLTRGHPTPPAGVCSLRCSTPRPHIGSEPRAGLSKSKLHMAPTAPMTGVAGGRSRGHASPTVLVRAADGDAKTSVEDVKSRARTNLGLNAEEGGGGNAEGAGDEAGGAMGGGEEERGGGEEKLTPSQKLQERLKKEAEERRMLEQDAKDLLNIAIRQYERGNYGNCVKACDTSLEKSAFGTATGGEASMWKAMAMEGEQDRKGAIELYKRLEKTHPVKEIRNQAEGLRIICEAPRLKIREEERVKIPDLDQMDEFSRDGFYAYRPKPRRVKKIKKSMEEEFLENWQPGWKPPNKYAVVAGCCILAFLAWYSASV